MKVSAAATVPDLNADRSSFCEKTLTINIPKMEQIMPREANPSGKNISKFLFPKLSTIATLKVEAIAMLAMIDPQYDSKISDPIPATSPTLSPTLSAMTPGFLGSSSGIPASIFPTRSDPTSAHFV